MSLPKQMPAPTNRVWNAPRLTRIGTIADVAANNAVITSQNPAKS